MKHLKMYEEFNNPFIRGNERKLIDLIYKLLKEQLDSGNTNYDASRRTDLGFDFFPLNQLNWLTIDNDKYLLKLRIEKDSGWMRYINIELTLRENFEDNEEEENDIPIGKKFKFVIREHSQKIVNIMKKLILIKEKELKAKSKNDFEDEIDEIDDFFNDSVKLLESFEEDWDLEDEIISNYNNGKNLYGVGEWISDHDWDIYSYILANSKEEALKIATKNGFKRKKGYGTVTILIDKSKIDKLIEKLKDKKNTIDKNIKMLENL